MFNVDDLVKLIKRAAVDAVNASSPANAVFGKVIDASPLKIRVDQKKILGSAQLVLSRNVTDYEMSVTVESTGDDGATMQEEKTMTVHNRLKVGETVILFQEAGGQRYFVLDRIGKG